VDKSVINRSPPPGKPRQCWMTSRLHAFSAKKIHWKIKDLQYDDRGACHRDGTDSGALVKCA
jgi:hypothetical protein